LLRYGTFHFVISYQKFVSGHGSINQNFKSAVIFENDIFRDPETGSNINKLFFGRIFYERHSQAIRKLRYSDCFTGDLFKTPHEFRNLGLPVSLNIWFKLRNSMLNARYTLGGQDPEATQSMETFVNLWKKGCKTIRKALEYTNVRNNPPLLSNSFTTFARLVDCRPDPEWPMSQWFSTWNMNSLPNDFRNFIYCCRYNYLPTNNRLNAYIAEVDPRCNLCARNNLNNRDSFSHCFLNCPYVRPAISHVLLATDLHINIDDDNFPKLYWYGIHDGPFNKTRHLITLLFFDIFCYVIFRTRKRTNICLETLTNEIRYFIECCKNTSNLIKHGFEQEPSFARFSSAMC
jgi:hypothetical protein